MSEEREELLILANAYLEEGKKLVMENKIRDAEKVILRAKDIYLEEFDAYKYVDTLNALGVIYSAMDDDSGCISCYLEGLSCAQNAINEITDVNSSYYLDMRNILGTIYNNIGSRYQMNEAYERALKYFKLAEEELDFSKTDTDMIMRRRAHVIYLNFTECYGQLDRYEEAWQSLNKAKENMIYAEDGSVNCSYLLLEYKLKAATGEKEYVKEHIQDLVDASRSNHDATDFMQDMRGVCDLVCWLGEFSIMRDIIESMEMEKDSWNSISFDIFITEMWMNYYIRIGDEQKHLEKCKEYAYLSLEQREHNHKTRADVIDIRIAFQENEEKRLKATENSYTDSLTGIGNRAKLQLDASVIVPSLVKEKKSLGIGIVDIDYFKQQNDTYGHLQGDECLKCVAAIISDVVKGQGEVYRFGGDEFVILVKEATRKKIKKLAENIKTKLHEKAIPNINSKVLPEVTLSQGYVCIYPKEGDCLEALMAIADKSLYNIKESGRNGYYVI